ncbi:MAG TPA: trigger factor [Burkholderiaceae bacterium]|nr:trigger factor [Burkholderiaceae bacterium]
MATQLETTGALERKLAMAVPVAEINRQVVERLRKLSRNVKMPGFRPGKVPMKMIERSYGSQVHAEVLGDAVSKAFSEAVDEHKLRVAGQPRIESREGTPEHELGFTATFEVYPEIVLGDPSVLELERVSCPVGEADVDRTIGVLRKQRVAWSQAERAAQDGDRVTIDFTGTIDGVAFQGGSATDFPFVLGEGRMLPDFEAGVRGAGSGETKTFPVAFPADYGSAELAGKTAQFEVSVKKVEAPQLPEVDEAFARQLGVPDGDLARMRADIRANLEREVAQRVRARNKAAAMEAIAGLANIELPRALVEAESNALGERAIEDLRQRGMDPKNLPAIPPDTFRDQAERRVRLGLIVAEIVRVHGLQAKPDQIRRQIEEFAQAYENPAEVVRYYFSDRNRLAEIEAIVVEQNVVDWVQSKARVTDRELAFEELMAAS